MLAFYHISHPHLPFATTQMQQVIIKLESKSKPLIFGKKINGSHLALTSLKIPAYSIALNTNTDIPPIISDDTVIHKYNAASKAQQNNNQADISPYRSRSVLYVQPKKVTPNEITDV